MDDGPSRSRDTDPARPDDSSVDSSSEKNAPAASRSGQPAPAPADEAARDEVEDGPAAGLLSRLLGFWSRPASNDDLAEALDNGHADAANRLPRMRREMIERVIAFDEKRVVDVMAPRADIIAVDVDTPLEDLIKAFAEAGHSRMPIYREDLDDPIGMAHIKDMVSLIANPIEATGADQPILRKIRRDVLYVPPSMRITDLLLKMQASRIHMALVIDEYGGTDGLVTIEDLVEEIVGDINDEHDEEEAPTITPRPGGWEVDARVELEDFAEETGFHLETDDEEADTLAGLVVSLAGRVPQRGEVLSHPSGLDFEVADADARKVRRLRIRRRQSAEDSPKPETDI